MWRSGPLVIFKQKLNKSPVSCRVLCYGYHGSSFFKESLQKACPQAPASRALGFSSPPHPPWFTQVSHSCTPPTAKTERKNGFSERWNSCSDVCHLDLKHGSYFPNSCYNKIVAKWFVWAISQNIITAPEQQNASSPTQTAAQEPSWPCNVWLQEEYGWTSPLPLTQVAAWVQDVAKKASKKD